VKAIKISIICSVGLASLFAIFSLVFHFGDWQRLTLVFLLGAFIGLVAAPEIEPKAFKNAWIFQSLSGIFSGGIVSLLMGLNLENSIAVMFIGGILGWSTPFWARYVQVP